MCLYGNSWGWLGKQWKASGNRQEGLVSSLRCANLPTSLQRSPFLFPAFAFAAVRHSHPVDGSQNGVSTASCGSVFLTLPVTSHASVFSSSELELYVLTEVQGTLNVKGLRLN